MLDPTTTAISVLALAISSLTAWLTLFRRGTVRMSRPTVIYFGPDSPRPHQAGSPPKVYLRTLLFSTSKRGRVVESMHIVIGRNEARQTFNIWVYGDDKLVRGSGLFVGETGVAANHHFLTPPDGSAFAFIQGTYRLEVFAKLLGDARPINLFSQNLEIDREVAAALREPRTGLYFDWGPDSGRYLPHVERRDLISDRDPDEMLKLMGLSRGQPTASDAVSG